MREPRGPWTQGQTDGMLIPSTGRQAKGWGSQARLQNPDTSAILANKAPEAQRTCAGVFTDAGFGRSASFSTLPRRWRSVASV